MNTRRGMTVVTFAVLAMLGCLCVARVSAAEQAVSGAADALLTVDAGKDRQIRLPFNFLVQAGKAVSKGGTVKTFRWTKRSGGPVEIASPTEPATQLTGMAEGTYVFRLTVTDDRGNTATDDATLTVMPADPRLIHKTWTIDGQEREAMVHVPAGPKETKVPVVIFFHGHGGYATQVAQSTDLQSQWPQALVVYPQGLPARGGLDPKGLKPGWQHDPQDYGGRDIKLFDAMVGSLEKEYGADPERIFVVGFSNGCSFLYNVLWPERGNAITAMAGCAGPVEDTAHRRPMPILHITGLKDNLAKFAAAQKTVDRLKKLNGCAETGTPWETQAGLTVTLFESPQPTPVVFAVHGGTHKVPPQGPALAVSFFKRFGSP